MEDGTRFVSQGGAPADVSGRSRLVARYDYDQAGNRISEKDIHGYETRYVLDPLYRVVKVQLPPVPGPSLADGQMVSYLVQRRYDRVGNKTYEADGNGHATSFAYGVDGEVVGEADAVGHDHPGLRRAATCRPRARGAGTGCVERPAARRASTRRIAGWIRTVPASSRNTPTTA